MRRPDQTTPQPSNGKRPETASAHPLRCILLSSGGGIAEPADLVALLSRRGVEVLGCDNVFEAMALALGGESRAPQSSEPTVVVVVEPCGFPRADELVEALARHASRSMCWRYDASQRVRLRGYVVEKTTSSHEAASPSNGASRSPSLVDISIKQSVNRPPEAAPRLRLIGEEPERLPTAPGSAPVQNAIDEPDISDVLSEEELRMLLGGAPSPDAPSADPKDWRR